MKNIFKLSFLGVAMTIAFSSCLKDKGFDNGEYGIQVIEKKAVSLPQAINGTINVALLSSDVPLVLSGPIFALETTGAQSSDVNVQFALKPELVDADPDLTLLPASAYTTNLSGTIKAGQLLDTLDIILSRSSDLDPNLTYGLGLELVSASNGFQIASNMKQVLIKISVKNKYDGVYEVTGSFRDVSAAGANFTSRYPLEYQLVTTGPSSVNVCMLINGEITPGYLFNNNGAGSFYGNFGSQVTFDPATNLISDMHNYYGDPANAASGIGNPALGSGAPNFAASNGRRITLDPSGVNAYDDATRIIRVKYFMLQPSVVPVGARAFFDETWTYIGPR